jgi:broad specificity phosphatase PhoE
MANLILIRHGQIKANKLGHWHGSTDSPLTRHGRRQARLTASHIREHFAPLQAIYASPLKRCRHTAEAIAAATGLEVQVHDGLREYAIGEWEGLPFQELHERHRFVEIATRDHDFAPPGGETLREVAARIVPAVQEINARHGDHERILVVGHGAALAVALGSLLEQDPARWTNYHFANCSLTELVLSPAPYVNFFNATHHL